jgi:hypothetical protein
MTRAQKYTVTRKTSGLSIVKPTAMLETEGPLNCLSAEIGALSKRNFQRPESNCGVAINSICEVFMVSTNVPDACASSVAGIGAGSAHHRGHGRERDYCADERTECRKPEICLHANYLKHSKIDISANLRVYGPGF